MQKNICRKGKKLWTVLLLLIINSMYYSILQLDMPEKTTNHSTNEKVLLGWLVAGLGMGNQWVCLTNGAKHT